MFLQGYFVRRRRMAYHYKLVGHEPVEVEDIMEELDE